jgi:hypothetical protein
MTLKIRFSTMAGTGDASVYRLDLDSPAIGQASGEFRLPFDPSTQRAIQQALAPNFALEQADDPTRQALQALGSLAQLPTTVGDALSQALLAAASVHSGFDRALGLAEIKRQPLPVELRFTWAMFARPTATTTRPSATLLKLTCSFHT